MIWATPAAWALAILAALPLLAHLWSRKRPAPLPFPTLRFLRAASPVSRRLRRVQDWPLLLLRVAIVAVICGAAAGPTLATRWRQHAWRTRLHRVIVVDAESAGPKASAAVGDLQRSAASSTVLRPAEIKDILDEAIAQADHSAGGRRTELAVVWGGSRLALTAGDVSDIPARVGVRLVLAGNDVPADRAPTDTPSGGLVIETEDAALRESLQADLEALRLPPSTTPIHLRLAPEHAPFAAPTSPPCRGPQAPALHALDDMSADVRLRDAADRSLPADRRADRAPDDGKARVLARSAVGEPLLRGWAEQGCLVLQLDSVPRSPLTWWTLVSAREALARIDRMASAERWTAADVATANRDGLTPDDAAMPGGLDTRAAWGVALALLLAEQAWRRRVSVSRGRDASAPLRQDAQEPVDAA